jgi:hypothetical protein
MLREKPDPAPICPLQVPHGLTRDRTRASALKGTRLTALATTRPLKTKTSVNIMQKCNSYRAVSTLRLGYKNQSVNVV